MVICVSRFICKSMKTIYHACCCLALRRFCYVYIVLYTIVEKKDHQSYGSEFWLLMCVVCVCVLRVHGDATAGTEDEENCPQETIFHT